MLSYSPHCSACGKVILFFNWNIEEDSVENPGLGFFKGLYSKQKKYEKFLKYHYIITLLLK